MNGSDISPVETLASLEVAEVERCAGLIAFLCLLVLTGIPGNILVCVIYRKSYRLSMARYFIFCLAINDTINSCIVVFDLISVSHPYTYPSDWLCKIAIFLEMWPTMTSAGWLGVISIDRYRKVCHPFGWQIRHQHARNIYIAIIILSLVFSWPTLVLFGRRDVDLSAYNITGHGCLILEDYDGTLYTRIYGGSLWLLFASVLITLIIFYSLIGKKIFEQMKKNTKMKERRNLQTITEQPTVEITLFSLENSPSGKSITIDGASDSTGTKSRDPSSQSDAAQKSPRSTSQRRSTYIMFLISLVFIVSFAPYLSLRLVQSLDKSYHSSLTNEERAAFKFFLRFCFLNCAVNPFIYAACMATFRHEVKALFWKICKW